MCTCDGRSPNSYGLETEKRTARPPAQAHVVVRIKKVKQQRRSDEHPDDRDSQANQEGHLPGHDHQQEPHKVVKQEKGHPEYRDYFDYESAEPGPQRTSFRTGAVPKCGTKEQEEDKPGSPLPGGQGISATC